MVVSTGNNLLPVETNQPCAFGFVFVAVCCANERMMDDDYAA